MVLGTEGLRGTGDGHRGDGLAETAEYRCRDTVETIRAATDKVAVGMELIDSRSIDFKFTLTDVIADNTSAAGFLIGQWLDYPVELAGRPVEFEVNGEIIDTATTDAILGNPDDAFVELAKMVLAHGFPLAEGSIIVTGSVTPAVLPEPDQSVTALIAGFPELFIRTAE